MSSLPEGSAERSVSVVVCTRDRPRLLASALDALANARSDADEVVVVDSASQTPATASAIAAAGLRMVRVERPGLSRARNAGIAATTGEVVAFTDDDCEAQPGWTAALAQAFDDPRVGFVLGRLISGDLGGEMLMPGLDADSLIDATADPALLGAGANMAFRRRALEQIGGFDEMLGAGTPLRSGEDHDAIWRALRAGWLGRYQPAAVVTHQEWRSRWALVRIRWGYGLGAGALAAKIARIDKRAGRAMLVRRIGPQGLGRALTNLARRWEGPAAGSVLYAFGVMAGAARVWRLSRIAPRDPAPGQLGDRPRSG